MLAWRFLGIVVGGWRKLREGAVDDERVGESKR
jgi:hypothetical protein